jgi:hypothetical protein
MKNKKFSIRLSDARLEKIRKYAEYKDTTQTHLVELWIDSLDLPELNQNQK